jgi:hypothetical protein
VRDSAVILTSPHAALAPRFRSYVAIRASPHAASALLISQECEAFQSIFIANAPQCTSSAVWLSFLCSETFHEVNTATGHAGNPRRRCRSACVRPLPRRCSHVLLQRHALCVCVCVRACVYVCVCVCVSWRAPFQSLARAAHPCRLAVPLDKRTCMRASHTPSLACTHTRQSPRRLCFCLSHGRSQERGHHSRQRRVYAAHSYPIPAVGMVTPARGSTSRIDEHYCCTDLAYDWLRTGAWSPGSYCIY